MAECSFSSIWYSLSLGRYPNQIKMIKIFRIYFLFLTEESKSKDVLHLHIVSSNINAHLFSHCSWAMLQWKRLINNKMNDSYIINWWSSRGWIRLGMLRRWWRRLLGLDIRCFLLWFGIVIHGGGSLQPFIWGFWSRFIQGYHCCSTLLVW